MSTEVRVKKRTEGLWREKKEREMLESIKTWIEQNRTQQNRTEQSRAEQNGTKLNEYEVGEEDIVKQN